MLKKKEYLNVFVSLVDTKKFCSLRFEFCHKCLAYFNISQLEKWKCNQFACSVQMILPSCRQPWLSHYWCSCYLSLIKFIHPSHSGFYRNCRSLLVETSLTTMDNSMKFPKIISHRNSWFSRLPLMESQIIFLQRYM